MGQHIDEDKYEIHDRDADDGHYNAADGGDHSHGDRHNSGGRGKRTKIDRGRRLLRLKIAQALLRLGDDIFSHEDDGSGDRDEAGGESRGALANGRKRIMRTPPVRSLSFNAWAIIKASGCCFCIHLCEC